MQCIFGKRQGVFEGEWRKAGLWDLSNSRRRETISRSLQVLPSKELSFPLAEAGSARSKPWTVPRGHTHQSSVHGCRELRWDPGKIFNKGPLVCLIFHPPCSQMRRPACLNNWDIFWGIWEQCSLLLLRVGPPRTMLKSGWHPCLEPRLMLGPLGITPHNPALSLALLLYSQLKGWWTDGRKKIWLDHAPGEGRGHFYFISLSGEPQEIKMVERNETSE